MKYPKILTLNILINRIFHYCSFRKLNAVSLADPAVPAVDLTCEAASVSTQVASQTRAIPCDQGIKVIPSGRLPSSLLRQGSRIDGTLAELQGHFVLHAGGTCGGGRWKYDDYLTTTRSIISGGAGIGDAGNGGENMVVQIAVMQATEMQIVHRAVAVGQASVMLRNVEIKAVVHDLPRITQLAAQLSGGDGELIPQHDVFYEARVGRLKMRRIGDGGAGTLIYYDRSDVGGPKLSEYELCELPAKQADSIHSILSKGIGIKGELKKKRLLFMVGQTRVHIDAVDGLGNFMELEVILNPDQSLEEGQQIARDLQHKLEVNNEDLLSGAYMDLLLKK